MAHGGIISTLLDEIMSWTIINFKKVFPVTRSMSVKYVRPVLIGMPLTLRGSLSEDLEPPKIGAVGEIRDDEGRLLVKSHGEFLMFSKEELTMVPEDYKEKMLSLFERLP